MKSLLTSFLFCSISLVAGAHNNMAFGNNKPADLTQVLGVYYEIKNALVNSDYTIANIKADQFIKAINEVDMKGLAAANHTAFMESQSKLLADAKAVAEAKNIDGQRTAFSSLSNTMYVLAKAARLSADPVYQAYCPMKKMYWLSNDPSIRNPYYGKMMLTCGKVTDTLK
jgi:hypothetical protein